MTADISVGTRLASPGGTRTIDLNSYTLTVNGGIQITTGDHLIVDDSATGGTLTAQATGSGNAGIGGNGGAVPVDSAGSVTVDGGSVVATGGNYGAGIGGGAGGTSSNGGGGGSVTVTDGSVSATGGDGSTSSTARMGGTGIGGGISRAVAGIGGAGAVVAASGGEVQAKGGLDYYGGDVLNGAGIGSGATLGTAASDAGSLSVTGQQGRSPQSTGGVGGTSTRAPDIQFTAPDPGEKYGYVSPVADAPTGVGSAHIQFVDDVPSAPVITGLTGGDKSLSAAFTAPSTDGGSPLTDYEYSTDGGATWAATDPVLPSSPLLLTKRSSDAADLENGTVYSVQLRAANFAAFGEPSNTMNAAPIGVTPKPTVKKKQQLRAGAAPRWIKHRGVTVVNKRKATTRQGRAVTAKVRVTGVRGEVRCFRLVKGPQRKLSIRTYGNCVFQAKVTYTASGTSKLQTLRTTKTLKVRR